MKLVQIFELKTGNGYPKGHPFAPLTILRPASKVPILCCNMLSASQEKAEAGGGYSEHISAWRR